MGLGQEKIDRYFLKLSKLNSNKGIRNDPLLGVPGHSDPPTTSSEGTGLETEECGGGLRRKKEGKGPARSWKGGPIYQLAWISLVDLFYWISKKSQNFALEHKFKLPKDQFFYPEV